MPRLKIEKNTQNRITVVFKETKKNKTLYFTLSLALFLHLFAFLLFPIASFKLQRYSPSVYSQTLIDASSMRAEYEMQTATTFLMPPKIVREIEIKDFDDLKPFKTLLTLSENPFWKIVAGTKLQVELVDENRKKNDFIANFDLLNDLLLFGPLEIEVIFDGKKNEVIWHGEIAEESIKSALTAFIDSLKLASQKSYLPLQFFTLQIKGVEL